MYPGIETAAKSIFFGAEVIEKHFMPKKTKLAGDYKLSVDFIDLKKLINLIKENFEIIGSNRKKYFNCEKYGIKTLRRSIYFFKNLNKGDKIKKNDIILLRPFNSTGVKIKDLNKILGTSIKKEVKKKSTSYLQSFKIMKNLKCVIEARMGSKRLPGKSMSQITPKFKLIDFVIGNALQSTYINKKNIFFLTSKNKNNKVLISHVKKNYGIKIFKGSEKNVYSRYKKFNDGKSYNILRLTADNPLIDPKLIDRFVECFTKSKAEYLTTRAMCHSKNWKAKSDFPKGISLEIFYSKKLFINDKRFNLLNQDSPTWFFFNKKFDVKVEKFKSFSFYKKPKKNSSFTIDTPERFIKN